MSCFSRRSRTDLSPNAFTRALEALRGQGRELLDLSSGNPTEQGLGWDTKELIAALSHPAITSYEPAPFGLWSARAALANELLLQGFSVPPAHILLTASTSEAYGFLFKLLCDPGDVVLVPEPSYPLLNVLSELEQVRLSPYSLAYDGEWHIDATSLRDAVDASAGRARAIVTVHPNNPTGSFLKQDELELLIATGLPIISDEVFADYALQPSSTRVPSALAAGSRALIFRLSGLSKQLALPQLKLAYTAIAGPDDAVHEACARLEHIADAYLSPSAPVQLALPALLARRVPLQTAISQRVRENLAQLERTLQDSTASVLRVEGGWYAIVRLPNVESDEAFCLRLLETQGVIAQPGYFFDLPDAHLVVSLIVRRASFAEGSARLRRVLDAP